MDASHLHAGGIPDPESGEPGGGRGRRDEVGGSGVYPASAGNAPADAVPRTQAEWGQGERGAAGYDDAGSSELFYYPAQLEAAEPHAPDTPDAPAESADPVPPEDERVAARRRMEWGAW